MQCRDKISNRVHVHRLGWKEGKLSRKVEYPLSAICEHSSKIGSFESPGVPGEKEEDELGRE